MMDSGSHIYFPDLEIGLYRPGEERGIADCMRVCFGRDRRIEDWRHLHLDGPGGPAIILLARHRDVVVCHVALVCRRIVAFGKPGLAGHALWAMTRPEWRRRGLGTIVNREVRQIAGRSGVDVTYGFVNTMSRSPAVEGTGSRLVAPPPLMVRPLRPLRAALALLGRRRRWPLAAVPSSSLRPSGWTTPVFDDRHTALFADVDALPAIAVVRDAAYLRWRYVPGDDSRYLQRDIAIADSIQATAVIHIGEQQGMRFVFVMDWLWRRGRQREGLDLMRQVIQVARDAGATGVAALAMPGTKQRRLLRRLWFFPVPQRLLPEEVMLEVLPVGDGERLSGWFEPSNWYVTFGDGDLL